MKIGKSIQRSVNDSIKFSLNDPIWVSTMKTTSNPLYYSVFSATFNSVINSLRFLRWI